MPKKIEVTVRKVEKFVVVRTFSETREDGAVSGGAETFGEFDRIETAERVASMVRAETEFVRPMRVRVNRPRFASVRNPETVALILRAASSRRIRRSVT